MYQAKLAALLLTLTASAAYAEIIRVPVAKDASLIRQSMCCSDAASSNFGSALTVDVGQYHHTSLAVFGFDLQALPTIATIKSAKLVLGSARIVGAEPAPVTLSSFWGDWDESTISWNSRPESLLAPGAYGLTNGENSMDVSEIFRTAYAHQQPFLSFSFEALGSSNAFITSKEDSAGPASYLLLDVERPVVHMNLLTSKDASVVTSSLANSNAANKNFGAAATVDAGSYHHQSTALIGFNLRELPKGTVIRRAVLSLHASLVGSGPALATFGHSSDVWRELKVIVKNRPQSVELFTQEMIAGKNEIDLTEIVASYVRERKQGLTFTVDAAGSSNIFIVSKEGNPAEAAILKLDIEIPQAN